VPKGAEHHWDNKTEFKLGKSLAEAHATFSERIGYEGQVLTMDQLCDRYSTEVIPKKAHATQKLNRFSIGRIRKAFSGNRVNAIQPQHLYAYQDHTLREESPKKAALDHEVLSHMFTCAIRWGVIAVHPMTDKKVVKPPTGPGRNVLPTLQDISALAATMPIKWKLYIALKVWTGRRKAELLRIKRSDLTEDGIRFTDAKNKDRSFIIAWEPETRAIVKEILRLPGHIKGMHLFSTREGKPYINEQGDTSGFNSIWQRYRNAAFEQGKISVKFTEHDMRKVRASQLKPEQAQELLQHTNPKMTDRYRPKKVVRIEQV
jgi:integrase